MTESSSIFSFLEVLLFSVIYSSKNVFFKSPNAAGRMPTWSVTTYFIIIIKFFINGIHRWMQFYSDKNVINAEIAWYDNREPHM